MRLSEQRLSEQRLSEQRLAERRLAERRLAERRLAERRLSRPGSSGRRLAGPRDQGPLERGARGRRRARRLGGGTALALVALLLAGCNDDARKAQPVDAGEPDAATVCAQTGELIQPEACDTRDNDCDGQIDEDYDLRTDVDHCGACSVQCDFGNGRAACVEGRCEFAGCPAGAFDLDGDPSNGCEGRCAAEPGDEICDGEDNDCDGRVDETTDTRVDITNCGSCGTECQYLNGEATCDDGVCRLARCQPGFGNLDGDTDNGCEAACTPANPGPEVCDGEDNDCNGMIDEGFDPMTDGENCGGCGVRCAFANAAGTCDQGSCRLVGCEAGFSNADGRPENGCESRCEASNDGVEICDDLDNDCNGVVDDGFDKEVDPENCGGCGAVDEAFICRLPNAESRCEAGDCRVDRCTPGFSDADRDGSNGCETACELSNGGVEICDLLDNNCDGLADEGFDTQNDVATCGACDTPCETGNAEPLCVVGQCIIGRCPPGMVDADQNPLNGCEYACVPTMDPTEVCDTFDNDCDGQVDEGFDIFADLEHCGGCGLACAPANALALCNSGTCDVGGCDEGWFDADGDVENGCEIECTPSPDGFEVCDDDDNDCDGRIDEDFDLTLDALNCGACGVACSLPNGRVTCVDGACRAAGCLNGWVDANGDEADGCEYRCTPTEDAAEVCDGRDNDCDGTTDNGFDVMADVMNCGACGNACVAANGTAACDAGRCRLVECEPGFVDIDNDLTNGCEAPCVVNGDETCNEVDDDCDGRTDEGFDLSNDVANCGDCGNACAIDNGAPFCNGGRCDVLSCGQGFVDLDHDPANGCECAVSNGGIESCDGVDNDCNGVVDDADRVVPPPEFGCRTLGVCRGVRPACRVAAWTCPYPDTFEQDETRCDALDNDCDGQRDEAFPELGRPCGDGVGVCRNEGAIACSGPAATACSAQASPERAVDEACNGIDDDCDGTADEGSDALVTIPAGNGVAQFQIYAYEASRTDANGAAVGQSFLRSCSKADALPWNNVDYATAVTACEAAGLTLCSAAQWGRACAGNSNQSYPYGNVYDANRCNGQDYDTNAMSAGNQDTPVPAGALAQCRRNLGNGNVYDLSGNLWEWTSESLANGAARALRGGSYGNISGGLTCQFSNATPVASFRDNIGFRCCTP